MNSQPLKDKRIALLGGMGARPEAKEKLIQELGLAELEWVYSERNATHPYENFCSGLRPGKYDYIFVLTKFSSHILLNKLRSSKPDDIPLVKISGSYNAENFLKALFEQAPPKQEVTETPEPKPQIVTKLLEPAKPHQYEPQAITTPEPLPDSLQGEKRWQELFGAPTPEKAKAKIDMREKSLEARIHKLSQTQQDQKLLDFAYDYVTAMDKFLEDMPTPHYVTEAKQPLVKSLKKHGFIFEKNKKQTMSEDKEELTEIIMRTNQVFTAIYTQACGVLQTLSKPVYNPHGACISCKMHKSIGCSPSCTFVVMQSLLKFFDDAKKYGPKGEMPEMPKPPEEALTPIKEPREPMHLVSIDGDEPKPLEQLPRKVRRFFEKRFGI